MRRHFGTYFGWKTNMGKARWLLFTFWALLTLALFAGCTVSSSMAYEGYRSASLLRD